MEKVSRVVITRKEEKELKKLEHLLAVKGIDIDEMEDRIHQLEVRVLAQDEEISALRTQIAELNASREEFKQECLKYIRSELEQIAVNIRKETSKNVAQMGEKVFSGSRINENI